MSTLNPLRLNARYGKRTIKGHALTKTMLQDPAIPACSIVLKGSQYNPQAEALIKINKLKEASEYIFANKMYYPYLGKIARLSTSHN